MEEGTSVLRTGQGVVGWCAGLTSHKLTRTVTSASRFFLVCDWSGIRWEADPTFEKLGVLGGVAVALFVEMALGTRCGQRAGH